MGIAGCNHDLTNRDADADDDLPSIEEILGPLLCKEISAEGCQSSEHTLKHLEGPTLDMTGSRLRSMQSGLDDGVGDSQGTRGMGIGSSSIQQAVS